MWCFSILFQNSERLALPPPGRMTSLATTLSLRVKSWISPVRSFTMRSAARYAAAAVELRPAEQLTVFALKWYTAMRGF